MSGYDKGSLSCLEAINVFCYNFLIYRFMKYLRLFEGKKLKFKVGNQVVLVKKNDESPFRASGERFKVGDLCTIIDIDRHDTEDYPYNISHGGDDFRDTWVSENQLRIAVPLDLDQKKYNL